ncbi:MAG: hypothetical protein ACI37Z_09400 [Candidatus Gastranaerophilaceae bacterium]
MNKFKKILLIISTILMISISFVGCGKNMSVTDTTQSGKGSYTVTQVYYNQDNTVYGLELRGVGVSFVKEVGKDLDLNGYDYIQEGDIVICEYQNKNTGSWFNSSDSSVCVVKAVNKTNTISEDV